MEKWKNEKIVKSKTKFFFLKNEKWRKIEKNEKKKEPLTPVRNCGGYGKQKKSGGEFEGAEETEDI